MFKIIDKSLQFISLANNALDKALNNMAIDVERLAKIQVPHNKGQLKASGYHERLGQFRYNVGFNKEYAAYQEWGGDGKKKIVKHYSKAGKKKFYLRDPVQLVQSKSYAYYKTQVDKIKL